MRDPIDIIVIGTGPAGMAASQVAAKQGAKTLVLDEQSSPGGQIFRAIEANENPKRDELGESYYKGSQLTRTFRNSNIHYLPDTSVWQLSKDRELSYSRNGAAQTVTAKQVIIATGAQERPMPVSGWTLPGVMTIGAAQILLKTSNTGIKDAIFVGSGPLFYLAVHQYMAAGIPVKAAIDLTPKINYLRAIPHLPGAWSGLSHLIEGWRWKREIVKSEIPLISGVKNIRITGEDAATGIEYLKNEKWTRLDGQHILLHQGIVPNINISLAAGCDGHWNEKQACWAIEVDSWFQSSIPGIFVAGDGASIRGGTAAELCGRIAALGALAQIGKITDKERNRLAKPYRHKLSTELKIRPFLDTLFKPADNFRIPKQDDIVVCRCEEITVAQIREAVKSGCVGPNQLKSFSRCGMGPCQGRFCGLTVTELIADILNKPVNDVGYYRLRPPIKPLLLQELANLNSDAEK